MKSFLVLLFTLLNITAFAQENSPDKNKKISDSSEEVREEQTTEGKNQEKESDFELGPYKNGQYQYFGEKELKARELEQEKEQQ